MLPHSPPPSTRFSARALIVFRFFSCLLQLGMSPHFIVCRTSFEEVCGDSEEEEPLARMRTGEYERGATLLRGSNLASSTHSSASIAWPGRDRIWRRYRCIFKTFRKPSITVQLTARPRENLPHISKGESKRRRARASQLDSKYSKLRPPS